MKFSFQTWEFVFGLNIAIVILFPWIKSRLQNIRVRALVLALAPLLLAFIESAFQPADFSFYLKLYLLHWGASYLTLEYLSRNLSEAQTIRAHIGIVLISLCLSSIKYLFSPSLIWIDPILGVLPGTIGLDPIISLQPYFARLILLTFAFALSLDARPILTFFLAFFIGSLIFADQIPSSYLSTKMLESHFQIKAKSGPVRIFIESDFASHFSADFWAEEFHFLWDELKMRLPSQAKISDSNEVKIFIYSSDNSKADWIGARETQIGNFWKGELHLSRLSPLSDILDHELAHLLHGKIEAPWISYLDPFYLEGLAVALASEDSEQTMDRAAALLQVLPEPKWPRGVQFFSRFPSQAAYALAGGFALVHLEANEWPWIGNTDAVTKLNSRTVSSELKSWAKRVLERKSLFKDPKRRDCVRLEWNYFNHPSSRLAEKLDSLCPKWKTVPSYQPPDNDLQIFERQIAIEKNPEFAKALKEFYLALSTEDRKQIAQELLNHWKFRSEGRYEQFKKRLAFSLRPHI